MSWFCCLWFWLFCTVASVVFVGYHMHHAPEQKYPGEYGD
jgi:hypothetical protein